MWTGRETIKGKFELNLNSNSSNKLQINMKREIGRKFHLISLVGLHPCAVRDTEDFRSAKTRRKRRKTENGKRKRIVS